MKKDVTIYDTTLRDGEQGEGINFSVQDKLRVALKLDEIGIDYIEGGWPGSNPKAVDFFKEIKKHKLKHARMAAFGSTCRKGAKPADDDNVRMLLSVKTPVVTIFGKSWDLHVREALRATLDENLRMIGETVAYLRKNKREVIYDAEHWFDGFKNNAEYAIKTIQAAAEAGAHYIVLCDTNGGTMPTEVPAIMQAVKRAVDLPLGIHTHDDAGMGVANAIMAVDCGATQVQGTINGYGERCGNCDLIQVMPNLELKYKKRCLPAGALKRLTELAHFVAETANLIPDVRQPYVGKTCFAHKGGIHVSAVRRTKVSYEHIQPELVGNQTRILISELSGQSNIHSKAEELGVDLTQADAETKGLLQHIKHLENEGFEFENAEGSFELLMRKALVARNQSAHQRESARQQAFDFFHLDSFRVIVEKRGATEPCLSEATVKLRAGGENYYVVAEANGPVDALDHALRKALRAKYPNIRNAHLTDFKVRIVDPKSGTAAKTRVLIQSTDGTREWTTVGVSENIIEAAWRALADSIEYKLMKDLEQKSMSRTITKTKKKK